MSSRHIGVICGAVAVLLGACMLAVLVGPAGLTPKGVLLDLLDQLPLVDVESGLTPRQQTILWEVRMPRVALGALVGAMLAVAGAAYQGVFRNPLADPYLLGVSSGAGLGATVAIVLGGAAGTIGLPPAAFVGGILAVAATYALGRTVGGGRTEVVIILAGVAVAAFANAIQTFLMQQHDDTLRQVYNWMLGRLATDGWSEVVTVLPYVLACVAVIVLFGRTLDVMAVGDIEASSLGIRPERVRLLLVCVATLGTAAVVSVSGLIGFVGIVIPHAVRLLVGPGHRLLLPLSLLVGAAFLVLADVVARTAMSPSELPIGVVTAAIGAPFFLVVLRRSGRSVE
ncbi:MULTISPECIES: FecCD family ABC transporter permease [Gordonia]|jgi:iron complex transport system permease protein|uniref:FecCD family ABC transporter permease n=1 Tax=Gordonia TaxID=2053 RepID=UPI0012BB324B|nr:MULTISPECIES: iron ABC transporter permease [Gordonia]MDH3010986.1 iron ABC transporter permease [Gordonia alkanivorans]MDH3017614.1 iron ABC transporter permease [Gordonia alkanivorans]MDH3026286.1 iron ABC transporter permease [Gordonia alkanivorans]MDH3042903.1 iron ABC transporter permease [Gordonia alkanivorans]MDH3044654.1 iron ABC transporter permease [Gordonia alkanivorans]